jgi:hypothetical protein
VLRAWETDYQRAALRDITRVFPRSYEVGDVVGAAAGSDEPFLMGEQDEWHDNVPVTLLPRLGEYLLRRKDGGAHAADRKRRQPQCRRGRGESSSGVAKVGGGDGSSGGVSAFSDGGGASSGITAVGGGGGGSISGRADGSTSRHTTASQAGSCGGAAAASGSASVSNSRAREMTRLRADP